MRRQPDRIIEEQTKKSPNQRKEKQASKIESVLQKNTHFQHVVIFKPTDYPFKNQISTETKAYKTILAGRIVASHLRQIVSLNHPNLIQIKKVSKGNLKSDSAVNAEIYYSFYYEIVSFSLIKLAQSSRNESAKWPKLTSVDLFSKLVEVSKYLMHQNIYFLFRLSDIGITSEGQIKIYVSPLIVSNSAIGQCSRADVMSNIDKLMAWWNECLAAKGVGPYKLRQEGHLTSSVGFTHELVENSQKITTSLIEKEREKITLQKPFQLKGLSIQAEIQQIKESMKVKRSDFKIKNYQQGQVEKRVNRLNTILRRGEGQPIKPKCLNPQKNAKPFYADPLKQNLNIPQFKIQPNHSMSYPKQLFLQKGEEENVSDGTYDIDLDQQFQPLAEQEGKGLRGSLQVEKRECPQPQYNSKKEERSPKGNKKGNQVATPKKITESAGPLQFKKFVLENIKPQFLAKKSNIYQDPCQYQSQRSVSTRKRKYLKEQVEEQERSYSCSQLSVSTRKQKSPKIEMIDKNVQNSLGVPLQIKINIKGKISSENLLKEGHATIKVKDSNCNLSKGKNNKAMNEKVKNALDKTRNIIALFNGTKAVRANNFRNGKQSIQ